MTISSRNSSRPASRLQGWEVKSLRDGRANLTEGYAVIRGGEAWLVGANFAPLTSASTHVNAGPRAQPQAAA